MKPIYQMSYEEFKDYCWRTWGIMVSRGYISDAVTGRVTDHRESEIVIKLPTLYEDEDGTMKANFKEPTEIKFRRLRDAIGYISKKRKNEVMKPYFKTMEGIMKL